MKREREREREGGKEGREGGEGGREQVVHMYNVPLLYTVTIANLLHHPLYTNILYPVPLSTLRLKLQHAAELDKLRTQFVKDMEDIKRNQREEKQRQLASLQKELEAEQVRKSLL